MLRLSTAVGAAFALLIATAAYAHAAPAAPQLVAEQSGALTLEGARQLVAQHLASAGQRTLRPGRAEFDPAGNVQVELVTLQGLPVGHLVVHPNSGAITDARASTKPTSKG